jgi:hypothetical protein
MLDENVVQALRDRYSHLHPLLVHRSIDRARSNGDLFDILDTIPDKYPIIWDEEKYRWVTADDALQSRDFTISSGRKK